eukprot:562125-Pelagomonas_calceolata.AAC.1
MAACAVMSSYDGAPCTLSVTRASPHLACLAGAGADSSLAAVLGDWEHFMCNHEQLAAAS